MKDENVLKKGIIAIVDSISLSFKDVLERAQKYGKLFAITLAVSVAAYSLLMCNQLVNKLDGVWHGSICYGGRHELSIGRWFWRFLDRFRFYLAPDPVSSVMALVFFILAIILVIDIFEVSKKPYMYAASLTFALNVSVCVCLSFRYMSSVFAIACLLGVFTAYVIIKAKNRIFIYIAAPVSIALMMGLYQAYIGCGTLVILLYLAYELYRDKKEYRELLMFILRTIIVYVIGGILYYVLLQINLVHYEVTMDDYNNASSYGLGPAIMNLPHSFLRIYNDFREYYGQVIMKTNIYEKKIYVVIFALIAIHLLIAIVNLFKRNKLKAVLFTACILLIPIGVDVVLFITYDSFTSVQMTIPLSMCIPALIAFISVLPLSISYAPKDDKNTSETVVKGNDKAVNGNISNEEGAVPEEKTDSLCLTIKKIYGFVCAVAVIFLIYGNYKMSIYDQEAMYMGLNTCKEMGREIVSQLQDYNLYHPYYKVVFVGSPIDNPMFAKNFVYEKANSYACFGDWSADDTRTVVQTMQGLYTNVLGINLTVADDDKLVNALESEYVMNMPIFPEYGSCALVDDVVVVKLSVEY